MPSSTTAVVRVGRAIGVVAILISATGCLYLLRGAQRLGPRVSDALPLDELPHRDATPLVLFVLVWAIATSSIALLLRPARLGRLRTGVAVALMTWTWTYAVTAISVATVRQIAAEDAFRVVAPGRAVVLPALLGLLAGAVVADAGHRTARAPQLLSWIVATLGLVGIVDGLLPTHASTLLQDLVPQASPIARIGMIVVSGGLVYVARPLGRGSRRALALATLLLLGETALHVLHSDLGAIATGALAAVLVARRSDFTMVGDPRRLRETVRTSLGVATAAYAAGLGVAWIVSRFRHVPFRTTAALQAVSDAAVGLRSGLPPWASVTVLAIAVAGLGLALSRWLAPWSGEEPADDSALRRARVIVREWGSDTLAPFVLRADKTYLFSPSGRSFVAYRVVAGVAVVSGDPVGPPDDRHLALDRFVEHARARGWRVVVLGASEGFLDRYHGCGLRTLYHGDEAVLDLDRFSLEGREIRKVRQSVARLAKAGYTVEFLTPAELTPATRDELARVASAWRGDAPVRGFAMAMDDLFRLEGDEALFVVGRDPSGRVGGFLHFAVSRAGAALSLSTMPRLRDTPNGFNEWLVCESIGWARSAGFRILSLNFAPFAALLAPGAELRRVQRLERRLLLATKGHFQLDNLLLFNRKFLPGWQRRFVVYERRSDLPRVAIAALAAESYLPLGTGR